MTPLWTSDEIAAACRGIASVRFACTGVTFDSREVSAGDMFVALTGEATDGHCFVAQAFANGAAGVLVSERVEGPHVLVPDAFAALQALARAARTRSHATVIGVTGSVGKTGTKEALWAALDRSAPGKVHRSVKSYNNHTGVPLSLARMPADAEFAVLEMGMNHAGELAALTRMVRPHVAIVTAIAPSHIEFFANEDAIADAKAEIFEGMEQEGTAIVPADSPHRERLTRAARAHAGRVVSFGAAEDADVRLIEAVRVGTGTFVMARLGQRELSFTVAQAGAHQVSNALAVLAVVEAAGGDLALAGLALGELAGLTGRGARVRVEVPGGEALVIDEAYNANPASMRAALAVLGEEPGRHVAVLGAMYELGERSPVYHAELAEPIVDARVQHAVLVGEEMRPLAAVLEGRVACVRVADAADALGALRATIAPGDAVLVKGSNGVSLAHVVAALAGSAR